jgi:hypothetical protein
MESIIPPEDQGDKYKMHEVDTSESLSNHTNNSPYKVSSSKVFTISAVLVVVLIVCAGFLYYVYKRLNDDDDKLVHTLDVTQKMEKMASCPNTPDKNDFDSLMQKLCMQDTKEESCAIQDLKNGSLRQLSDKADKILSDCVNKLPTEPPVQQTH